MIVSEPLGWIMTPLPPPLLDPPVSLSGLREGDCFVSDAYLRHSNAVECLPFVGVLC